MSLMIDVLRHAHDISHAARLVLLAITAYIEEHGAPAYPSQATLAHDSGVTERYIEACVQECEAAGYLHVERRRLPGTRPRNFYTVLYRWRTIPEQPSGNQVHRTSIPLEKKEKQDLQEQRDQGTTIPESPTPIVTPAAAKWLHSFAHELSPDYAQVLQGVPAQESPPTRPKPPRQPALYFQGKLCPGGHDDGTGHTLRRVKNGNCTECDVARTRAKRQAAKVPRVKPARQVIDLAAHRQRQEG